MVASLVVSSKVLDQSTVMKNIVLATALALVLVGSYSTSAQAQEEKKKKGERPPLTEEQKALMKEITAKYDTDKDGKLSPEERAKISAEDKEKMTKAGLGRGPGKGKEEKKKE